VVFCGCGDLFARQKRRKEKRREEKGRKGKKREEKGREGKRDHLIFLGTLALLLTD
jgi:hypothetical protein